MGTFSAQSPVASSVCQFNQKPASQLHGDSVCVSKVSFVASRRAGLSSRIRASVEANGVGSSDKDSTGAEATPAFNPFAPGKISSRMPFKKSERQESSLPVSSATATTTVTVTSEAPSSTATESNTPTPQVSSPFMTSPSAPPSQIPSPSSPEPKSFANPILSSAKAFDLPDELSDKKVERYKAKMAIAVRQERMQRAKLIAEQAARKKAETQRMMMLLDDSDSESDGQSEDEDEDEDEEETVARIQPKPQETFIEGTSAFFDNLNFQKSFFAIGMVVILGVVIGTFIAADKLGAFRQVYAALAE